MRKYWETAPVERALARAGVPKGVQIGNVRIAPATILAPMAGVTDTVFRRFIRDASFLREPGGQEADLLAVNGTTKTMPLHGKASACGLIMTEFTSADGVFRSKKARERYLHFYEDEHPISAQLFGADAEVMASAAKMVEDLDFDLVDLNLGCPAKRVVKCNGGSGLLRDLPRIRTIFEKVRAAVKIPFTVKFRAGWDDSEIVCVELARMAEECGLNAVALHARTREQGYSGNARWEWIAAVKDAVKVPVIGNGDIRAPEDAAAMIAQTGCDAVMIGRTAPANPWIFKQIAQYSASLEQTGVGIYDQPTDEDRYWMIKTYFEMLVEEELPGAAGKMKQFAAWFTHGVPNGSALRKSIYEAKTESEILEKVEHFFEKLQATSPAQLASAIG
jgi:nifR3 family TIM-barrel protein